MAKARILIVEDEAIVAFDLETRLTKLGYSVCGISNSGEDAAQKAETERPDLVLMDILLAGKMSGIEAAEQIHADLNIPVIYVTAYTNREILERTKKIPGPFGHVFKPFSDDDLADAVETALHRT